MSSGSMVTPRQPQLEPSRHPVPAARGTCRRVASDVGQFLIIEARFAPFARLPEHFHDRPSVVLAIGGTCTSKIGAMHLDMAPGDLVIEPAGESHANHFGPQGTDVLILQPDPRARDVFEPCAQLLTIGGRIRDAALLSLAWRIHGELTEPDTLSRLALEAAALEFVVTAARSTHSRTGRQWLVGLVEYMHAEFLNTPTIRELSSVARIHPAHLSREFRRAHRVSPMTYMRRLRIEWAAQQLRGTESTLSDIAAAAGFADQSHFTRVFRRVMGITPARHRAVMTSTRNASRHAGMKQR